MEEDDNKGDGNTVRRGPYDDRQSKSKYSFGMNVQ